SRNTSLSSVSTNISKHLPNCALSLSLSLLQVQPTKIFTYLHSLTVSYFFLLQFFILHFFSAPFLPFANFFITFYPNLFKNSILYYFHLSLSLSRSLSLSLLLECQKKSKLKKEAHQYI